ncbi:iron complex outermembrane recepter protein [Sphingomonas laterariae]|uniref:Iron complex outermembrane recepter protein n=1 Tax=Edaphosphingomonas laterariae TaxID=861865 RepID=A0A239DY33_9SPHN|nr:TonB-dependent receptor [Sphingomonas laterariae]SNS36633.1 iron complex outermembrane recepter protein [Sphingomonas laterariae]
MQLVDSRTLFRARSMRSALLAAGAAMLLPAMAQAQDAAAPAASEGGLEDIVVTAQKRSESLQQTPLAISAVSADTIATRRITDASMLSSVAPNLSTTTGPSSKGHLIIQIRGIGESEPILTADSPIGVYVDGVIVGRSTGAVFELVDLERIEVLRGPQGTLYGRNTTGGAVNLITKKPADEFGMDVAGSYGNRGYWQGKASVDTGEFGDSGFKAKLSYLHKQADGYVDNLNVKDSRDPGAYNTDAVRAALAFDRGGVFRFDYTFDWAETKAVAAMAQLTVARQDVLDYFSRSAAVGGTAFIPPSTERRSEARPDVTATYDRTISHVATAEVDFSDSTTFRSITGFREWKNTIANTDLDNNSGLMGLVVSPAPAGIKPVQLFGADNDRKQHQFSQELNLLGQIGDNLEYVAGAFYFREEARETNPQTYTFVRNIPNVGLAGINLVNTVDYNTESESKALFGQATYNFTDDLSFTGGVRYTWDDKKLVQRAPFVRQLSRGFSKFNYAATLTWQATPDIMTYARIATGYKAGGFNPRAVNDGYDPETVTNYELGVKSEFFDRRLRFNGTLFYMDLKDKQLNQFVAGSGGAASQTINAGKADFKGVEVEVEALPFDGLRLNAAFGYVDRNFKELLAVDPADNIEKDYADIGKFSYSPSTTLNAGAQYSIEDVAGGTLSFRADYTYKSKVHYNVLPGAPFSPYDADIAAPGYGLLDARIALADVAIGGTEATFTLWGKNLTDKVYRVSGIDFGSLGFAVNTYGEPRSYGVDARFKF